MSSNDSDDDDLDDIHETLELTAISATRGASMQQLAQLSETLLAMAAGDFGVRADRTFSRDPFDVVSYLVNNTADELEALISRVERQNSRLESILEAMGDGILLLDPSGRIERTNASFQRFLGHTSDEHLLGTSIVDFVSPASLEAVAELLPDNSEIQRLELEFITVKDGIEAFPVTWSPIGRPNEIVGHVIAVHDDRELRMARQRAQLNDRMAAMGAMAAGVAHEINNPLAYVAANIDYVVSLLDSDDFEQGTPREALADALDGVRRVREIVADLNSFSRADDESKSVVPTRDMVESAIKMLGSEIRLRTRLEVDLPEDLPILEANEPRLVQVFVNILMNALQALEAIPSEERMLRVQGELDDKEVRISIADNAGGISDEDLPRVFDAFFTTKPVGKGTGLGLAISHKTVANLGGRIEIDTSPGHGTTFTVTLPRQHEVTEDDLHVTGLGLSEESERIESRRILIIDDEPALARAVGRILSAHHDVCVSTDPAAALELLRTESFGAVLCDVMMPRLSGIDIYRKMKSARPELAERFIFMTGGAFTEDAQNFIESVSATCLRKPFDFGELNRLIERLIR